MIWLLGLESSSAAFCNQLRMRVNAECKDNGSIAALIHSPEQGLLLGHSPAEPWLPFSASPKLRQAASGYLYLDSFDFSSDAAYFNCSNDGFLGKLRELLSNEIKNFSVANSENLFLIGKWHTNYDETACSIWQTHLQDCKNELEPLSSLRLIGAYLSVMKNIEAIEIVYDAPLRRHALRR